MHDVIGRRERGVVLVILALTLVALLLFAALVVDVGAAWSARRKAQTTADGGVLGGGQLFVAADGTLTGATADTVADEIIELTHVNLVNDPTMSDVGGISPAEWRQRFATCTDPDRDAARFPVRSTVSACISFNNQLTRVRVRLPDLDVTTFFAGIVGIDAIQTHAAAEADLVPNSASGVLPFGLPSANAGDPTICLKGKNQPSLPPCDGAEEGNFGNIDVSLYGNPVLGTPTECTGDTQRRLAANIALGVDHYLSTYSSGLAINDRNSCPDLAAQPNEIMAQTGVGSSLDLGMITGLSVNGRHVPGRLTTGPWADRNVRGPWLLDDRPLWDFMDQTLTSDVVPPACVPSSITSRDLMAQCLQAYRDGGYSAAMFTRDDDGEPGPDVLRSPRFAWVPQLHALQWGSPDDTPQRYRILTFRPVFVQTLYFACSNNANGPAGCSGYFDPGEGDFYFDPSTGTFATRSLDENRTLEAVTAMLLTEDMVGPAVVEAGPTGPRVFELVLRR